MTDTRPGGWAPSQLAWLPTAPDWLPSQLDMLRAEQMAWTSWKAQNQHVRLTRPIPPRDIARADLLLAAALGAIGSAVLVLAAVLVVK